MNISQIGRTIKKKELFHEAARAGLNDKQRSDGAWQSQIKSEHHADNLKV